MRRLTRIAVSVVVAVVLVYVLAESAWQVRRWWSIAMAPPGSVDDDAEGPVAAEPLGPPGGPVVATAPPRIPEGARDADGGIVPAAARAFAWAGEVADGGDPAPLDDEAAEWLPVVEPLVAAQEREPGKGLATVTPQGIRRMLGAPPGFAPPAAAEADPAALRDLGRALGAGAAPLAPGEHPEHACDLVPEPGGVDLVDPGNQMIRGRGVWAHIDRGAGSPPLRLELAEGAGGYAVSFHGEDFSRLRVDGGLVVPGRFYRIDGAITVGGPDPVAIHIRPLNAVPAYHQEPLLPPTADG